MRHLILALPLVAMGCVPVVPPAESADACGATGYASLVGTNIAAVTLPAGLNMRIIGPGDVVTMDLRLDRLNFETDAAGVITRVYCG